MKFRFHEKDFCKYCNNITYIQKGLNKKDYRMIINVMASIIIILGMVSVSLYLKLK